MTPNALKNSYRMKAFRATGIEAFICQYCLHEGKPPSLSAIRDFWSFAHDEDISMATASRLKAKHALNPRAPSAAQLARRKV